jgi:L-alanine-DL-glutamate epimerase-like enolase superfamily enzyme
VLIDGNEAFTSLDELDAHVGYWQKKVLVAAIEQPFAAASLGLSQSAKGRYPFPVFADESVVHGADIEQLATAFDGINIKLQKTGSYQEALRQKQEAARLNLKIMVGCMVETSLGIWQGLQLASGADFIDLDSMLYLTNEPFAWVREEAGNLIPQPTNLAKVQALFS